MEALGEQAAQLAREPPREVLRARVVDREDQHVLARRGVVAVPVANLDDPVLALGPAQHRVLAGHDPVLVEQVAQLADDRLDGLEVDHETVLRELGVDLDEHAVVVPVQALGAAVGEDQEVGGGEAEVLLLELDRKALHRRNLGPRA